MYLGTCTVAEHELRNNVISDSLKEKSSETSRRVVTNLRFNFPLIQLLFHKYD